MTTKQCNTADTKKSFAKNKMVYNEDLDAEIKRTADRLSYLRRRKKDGHPLGSSGTYTSKTKVKRPRKQEDVLHLFYRTHMLDGSWQKDYESLHKEMVKATQAFASYHNQVYRAISKYGNEEQMEHLRNMCNSAGPGIINSTEVKIS